MDAQHRPAQGRNQRLRLLLIAGLLLGIFAIAGWLVRGLLVQPQAARKAPKISVLAPPPPPPPPPPPKFEKKPDPPKEQKEMKLDQPAPKPEPAPVAQPPELKMDGPAGNGPSSFAAGKITSDDLSKIGSGKGAGGGTGGNGGGMFNPYANYMNLAKGEVQRHLNKADNLRSKRYAVEVRLWLTAAGAVSRHELVGSSGDADTDEAIQQALARLPALTQALPAAMPQPLRLRVSTGA